MKILIVVVLSLLNFTNSCFAGFQGFDFEDNPSKPVTHAGALLIKKYPQNHPDGAGEQTCVLFGHDKNFDTYAPPAGGVEVKKDIELREGKTYYSSLKTIQREVLEETGGLVDLNDEILQKSPMLYSSKFHDLLAVIHDDKFSCTALIQSVKKSLVDETKDAPWKEMDHYAILPVNNVLSVAKIMRIHFENGGNINNLPDSILSPRKSNGANTPLVYIKTRLGATVEFCAYYMGAIADTLPQFQEILEKIEFTDFIKTDKLPVKAEDKTQEKPLLEPQQPIPQEQKKSLPVFPLPVMQKQIPQKQISSSPSKKPILRQESAPQENIKTTPVKIITKAVLAAKKVIPARAASVAQKPVAKSNASTLVPTPRIAKAVPIRTNKKAAKKVIPTRTPSVAQKPVAKPNASTLRPTPRIAQATSIKINRKATSPVRKAVPARVSSISQKLVATPKAFANRGVKVIPVKANVKPAQVRAKAKAAPTPTKAKMLGSKVIKSAPVRTKVNPALARGNAKGAPGTKAAFLTNEKKIQQKYNGKNRGLRADQKRVH